MGISNYAHGKFALVPAQCDPSSAPKVWKGFGVIVNTGFNKLHSIHFIEVREHRGGYLSKITYDFQSEADFDAFTSHTQVRRHTQSGEQCLAAYQRKYGQSSSV